MAQQMSPDSLARIAHALGDPTRLRVYQAIAAGRRPCCGELSREVDVSAATMTHHVRVLQAAGLVAARREGAFVRVEAVPGRLAEYRAALGALGPRRRPRRSRAGSRAG
jgi:ArsR family transcriptional regulator, arsenate/arsenite/antimonite-responsive transcriptional repressor